MLGPTAQDQQEALGVLGVNLMYAALTMHDDPYSMLNVIYNLNECNIFNKIK